MKSICINFLDPTLVFRITHSSGKNQLIAKAVGIKSAYKPPVLDATAGLGVDAMILACLGCEVRMIERSPVIGTLLADALERLQEARRNKKAPFLPTNFCLKLTVTDAIDYIKNFSGAKKPDVIYLDPMYPERKKSALGKQKMRLIKEVVGEDLDAPQLLEAALQLATKRVVVKRPRLAPPLSSSHTIDIVFKGNTSRYDVYLT
jgi:16S rRNA (guanine1516-N2)-methyltransferase